MLYCDSRCSQTLTGLSLALPGAVLCNATRRLGDRQCVILGERVRGSVKAVRAVRNTRVFQMETRVVADEIACITSCTSSHLIPSYHTTNYRLHLSHILISPTLSNTSCGSKQLRESSQPGGIIPSHPLPTPLEPEPLCLTNSFWMLREVWRALDDGLSVL
jgi:hypothetical protein